MANISKPLNQGFAAPSIVANYGPYASVPAAHAALAEDGLNVIGMTVGIEDNVNHTITEYWYQGGTAQANLVQKQQGGGVDAYTKTESDNKYQAKGNYATVSELNTKANASDVNTALNTKQNVISDLNSIRSGAAAGSTAQQPATSLAGYGITDGYTKTEGLTLESNVTQKLNEQDAAIALLNGNDVVVVDDLDNVATPDTQKIYRVPDHTEEIDGQGTEVSLIESDYYSYLLIDAEPSTVYKALDDCVFLDTHESPTTIIGDTITTSAGTPSQYYAIAKQVASSSDVADLSYTKTNNDVEPTFYTDYMCVDDTTTPVTWKKIGTYTFPGIDNTPTSESRNLITSGGVKKVINKCVQLDKSVNLFNKNDNRIQINKTILPSGNITDLNNACITHPIYVEANSTIKVPYNGNFGNNNRVKYTDNGQVVDATLEIVDGTTVAYLYSIPRSGYVLVNYWKTQEHTLMICKKEEFPSTYVPYYNKIEEGVDLSNQQKASITEAVENKANLVSECGKNLFNKFDILTGCYINTSGNIANNPTSIVSGLIEITPGQVYNISRPSIATSGAVRFLDVTGENKLLPQKVDGTEWTHYDIGGADTGSTYQSVKCKAPATAKYIQFTVVFVGNGDINNTQVELGPDFTGYEPYYNNKVLPYEELPNKLLEQIGGGGSGNSEERIINIENSDKIGVFSTSFMQGYCMKNHHHLNHLSMFLDYIIYNYGHSGDDELENLEKLESNTPFLGVIPPSKWNIKYGIIMHQENSGALRATTTDTIYENSKKLANAVRSLGGIPIFSTEFDNKLSYYQGAIQLCNEEGYMFMNWGILAEKLYNSRFDAFWYAAHPSTRTGWMIANGMLPYLQSLPRPTQAIKLFRVRQGIDTSNLQNLVFEDLYSRAERYVELTCGVTALTDATEKYFDRLDSTGKVFADVNDEYQYIQNKQAVTFGNYAMANIILPYTKAGLKSLSLYLSASNVSNVYIQKVRQLSNPLPSTRNVAFGITSGASNIEVGDTFTVTGGVYNNNIKGTYTVSGIINGVVITTTSSAGKTTSGTDAPVITSSDFDVSSVTLSGSYDYPSYEYMSRYNKPLGEWVEITSLQGADGGYVLDTYIDTCVNFDSIAILLKGSNISLSDIYAKVSGNNIKPAHSIPMVKRKEGTSIITDSNLDNSTSWEGISNITTYDNTQTVSTVSAQYERLPVGITTVKEFQEGESIKQPVLTSVLNNNNPYGEPIKLQIRVIARYFPTYVNSDTKWNASEITQQSLDVARFAIYFGETSDSTNPTKVAEFNVGAWWNEFIVDTYCAESCLNYVKAICTDKKVQVAKIEVVKINN